MTTNDVHGKPLRWEEFVGRELRDFLKRCPMVLWPFGSIEQHGPHLPLSGDTIPSEYVAHATSAKTQTVVLPTMHFGSSQLHGRTLPGTLSVRPQTLMAVFEDVTRWIYDNHVRKMLVVNGHGGNIPPLLAAKHNIQHDLPSDFQLRVLNWYDMPSVRRDFLRDVPEAGDMYVHAGWSVTSVALATRPDLVNMAEAVNVEDKATAFEYRMDQISTSGVVGRATTDASERAGRYLLENAVRDMVALVLRMREEEALTLHDNDNGPRAIGS